VVLPPPEDHCRDDVFYLHLSFFRFRICIEGIISALLYIQVFCRLKKGAA
jgi:hypothetical protein